MAGRCEMKPRRLQLAKTFPGLAGMDLAKVVSCKKAYEFTEGEWALGKGYCSTKFKISCGCV